MRSQWFRECLGTNRRRMVLNIISGQTLLLLRKLKQFQFSVAQNLKLFINLGNSKGDFALGISNLVFCTAEDSCVLYCSRISNLVFCTAEDKTLRFVHVYTCTAGEPELIGTLQSLCFAILLVLTAVKSKLNQHTKANSKDNTTAFHLYHYQCIFTLYLF